LQQRQVLAFQHAEQDVLSELAQASVEKIRRGNCRPGAHHPGRAQKLEQEGDSSLNAKTTRKSNMKITLGK